MLVRDNNSSNVIGDIKPDTDKINWKERVEKNKDIKVKKNLERDWGYVAKIIDDFKSIQATDNLKLIKRALSSISTSIQKMSWGPISVISSFGEFPWSGLSHFDKFNDNDMNDFILQLKNKEGSSFVEEWISSFSKGLDDFKLNIKENSFISKYNLIKTEDFYLYTNNFFSCLNSFISGLNWYEIGLMSKDQEDISISLLKKELIKKNSSPVLIRENNKNCGETNFFVYGCSENKWAVTVLDSVRLSNIDVNQFDFPKVSQEKNEFNFNWHEMLDEIRQVFILNKWHNRSQPKNNYFSKAMVSYEKLMNCLKSNYSLSDVNDTIHDTYNLFCRLEKINFIEVINVVNFHSNWLFLIDTIKDKNELKNIKEIISNEIIKYKNIKNITEFNTKEIIEIVKYFNKNNKTIGGEKKFKELSNYIKKYEHILFRSENENLNFKEGYIRLTKIKNEIEEISVFKKLTNKKHIKHGDLTGDSYLNIMNETTIVKLIDKSYELFVQMKNALGSLSENKTNTIEQSINYCYINALLADLINLTDIIKTPNQSMDSKYYRLSLLRYMTIIGETFHFIKTCTIQFIGEDVEFIKSITGLINNLKFDYQVVIDYRNMLQHLALSKNGIKYLNKYIKKGYIEDLNSTSTNKNKENDDYSDLLDILERVLESLNILRDFEVGLNEGQILYKLAYEYIVTFAGGDLVSMIMENPVFLEKFQYVSFDNEIGVNNFNFSQDIDRRSIDALLVQVRLYRNQLAHKYLLDIFLLENTSFSNLEEMLIKDTDKILGVSVNKPSAQGLIQRYTGTMQVCWATAMLMNGNKLKEKEELYETIFNNIDNFEKFLYIEDESKVELNSKDIDQRVEKVVDILAVLIKKYTKGNLEKNLDKDLTDIKDTCFQQNNLEKTRKNKNDIKKKLHINLTLFYNNIIAGCQEQNQQNDYLKNVNVTS